MRVLVTGGAGFIGSATCRYLVGELGHEVVNLDKLTYAACLASLAPVADDPRYRFVEADICDRDALDRVLAEAEPDAVMHLAAESHVDRSITGAGEFITTNLVGTYTLLEAARAYWSALPAARREAFRFLHVSTDEVYGSLGETGLFTETTPYDPSSPYSASKAGSDHLAIAWHRTYGLPVVISNCSNNYGPYHFPEKLIPLMILNGLAGRELPVYGDGGNVRDWLYVEDHVRALYLILTAGRLGREVQCRRPERAHQSRDRRDDLWTSRPAGAGRAAASRPYPLRRRSARPRPPLRHRPDPQRDRARLAGGGKRRERAGEDRPLVSRQRGLVAAAPRDPLCRRASRAGQGIGRASMATPRRILLFGGSGQVGSEFRDMAWPEGFTLIAPDRSKADIGDRAAVATLLAAGDIAAVINTAAWTAVDAAEDDEAAAFAANALGPAVLAEETRRHDIPLIHVSTDYVFDGTKPAPYVEDDPTRPIGVYGASKLAGEDAVRTGNPRHLIVRTAWVIGRHGKNFVKTMLHVAASRDMLRVVDDQHGTPTAAADLAAALATMATSADLPERAGIYHFANRGETTWCGLAREVFRQSAALGGPSATVEAITTADYPTPARRPANSRLATEKIERDFGIAPRPWQEAVAEVVGSLVGSTKRGNVTNETLQ